MILSILSCTYLFSMLSIIADFVPVLNHPAIGLDLVLNILEGRNDKNLCGHKAQVNRTSLTLFSACQAEALP